MEPLIEESRLKPGKKLDRLVAHYLYGVSLKPAKGGKVLPYSTDLGFSIATVGLTMRGKGYSLVLEDLTMPQEGEELWQASFSTYVCFHKNPAFAICVAALKALKVVEP